MAKDYEIYKAELTIETDNEKQHISIAHRGQLTDFTILLINELQALQEKYNQLLLEWQINYE